MPRYHIERSLLVVVEIAVIFSLVAGEACCADCLDQIDPKNSVVFYDPLVFEQCSAAVGICCYGCSFSHGTLEYQDGVTFDINGSAQVVAGQQFAFTLNNVSRVTYSFLKTNQAQTSFIGNKSTVANYNGEAFTICVDDPGTILLRGWGTDECTQVTEMYTIEAVQGDVTTTCDSKGSSIMLGSASSAHNELINGHATTSSLYSDDADHVKCDPTRGTVVTNSDGSKVCKCTGDWRNPPTCDEFSYVKVIITILGAVATVVSILISVRAYIKSRKAKQSKNIENNGDDSSNNEDDILSVDVIRIGTEPPLATPCNPVSSTPGSRSSFIKNQEVTSTKETTL